MEACSDGQVGAEDPLSSNSISSAWKTNSGIRLKVDGVGGVTTVLKKNIYIQTYWRRGFGSNHGT